MKIIDLKKVNRILLVMVIFLSYQIPVWADTDHTTVKIPVQQIFSSEAEDISGRCSYVMTTNQDDAPMPEESRNMKYSWKMENNSAVEIVMKVKTAGLYQYKIYQTSEKKDNYQYDQNSYVVIVEAFYDQENQLKVVTVVKNYKGEKVESIIFENCYIGKDKEEDSSQSSNAPNVPKPHRSSKSGRVKTGDDSSIIGYFILLVISAVCMGILIDEKQRRKKEESQNKK